MVGARPSQNGNVEGDGVGAYLVCLIVFVGGCSVVERPSLRPCGGEGGSSSSFEANLKVGGGGKVAAGREIVETTGEGSCGEDNSVLRTR